jgi:hypothetical protein
LTERSELSSLSGSSSNRDPLFIVALIVLTLAVYWPVIGFEFLSWDDTVHIVDNPLFKPPTVANIGWYWVHPFYGLYIPVTYSLWTVLGLISVNASLFHATNLVVHLACVVLVYFIVRRLVASSWAAFLGAAIFAVHPMQVETVAWVSAFRDLLGAMLMLAAVLLYLRRQLVLVVAAFVLAILSKPTTIVLPVLLVILRTLTPSPRIQGEGGGEGSGISNLKSQITKPLTLTLSPGTGRGDQMALFVMILMAAACVIWTRAVQPSTLLRPSPLWSRPLVALDALAFYLFKLTWPAKLGFDYGRTPQEILASGQAYFTWLVPAGVAVALIAMARRRRLIVAAALIFVAGLLPVLGLLPFDFQDKSTVADHYVYPSMLAAAIFVTAIVAWRDTLATRAIVAVIVVLLGVRSWMQTWNWQDTHTLATSNLSVNPRSWSSLNLLAYLAFDDQTLTQDVRLSRAESLSRESLGVRENVDALINLGRALALENREQEALAPLARAVQLRPNDADAHTNLGATYYLLGRLDDAQHECDMALRLNPRHPEARNLLQLLQSAGTTRPASQPATTQSRD